MQEIAYVVIYPDFAIRGYTYSRSTVGRGRKESRLSSGIGTSRFLVIALVEIFERCLGCYDVASGQ